MQRGAEAKPRTAPPGVFETIALAVSALLVQPLPLAVPILIDLYLWVGPRLSPAGLTEPLARLATEQPNAWPEGVAEGLTAFGGWGDLVAAVGLFVPSLLGFVEAATPWSRPAGEPLGAALGTALVLLFLLVGLWVGMLFSTMLARMVRDEPPIGAGWLRAATVAAFRYLGYWLLVGAAVGVVMIPTLLIGVVLAVVRLEGLLALTVIAAALVGFACLAFVRDAIALVAVGPLRAVVLSFGVARRHPWPTVGFLVVAYVAAGALASLLARGTGTVAGVAVAVLAYAAVATALELARMQFFADRLRRWRPDLVPFPSAST